MKEIIKSLVESFGPSGYETKITDFIRELVEKHVDEVKTDPLGNLFAIKKGSGQEKTIMFSAHTDEIGVVVTDIDDKGFLRFSNVGGLLISTLVGNRVQFANNTVGVIYQEKAELKELTLDKLFIDIGVENKEQAEKKVRIGDFAVINRDFYDMGNRLIAKSLDDRIGCAILVEAIRRVENPKNTLFFVFSTQEEVGLRGAQTASYTVNPDLGIALDVTRTGDTPESPRMAVALGDGAAIKIKDSSLITHPKVKALLTKLAEEKGIKYQYEVLERGGTDAGAIHLTRGGVPSGTISIPCRYVHTASEMVDIRDVENCVQLVVALSDANIEEI